MATHSIYGLPGLIDMPTAQMAPDAQLSTTFAFVGGTNRNTLMFQILPNLTGTFRYSSVDKWAPDFDPLYDRSFDLRYQLWDEQGWRPAVAVGFQDFIGTGVYSAEYFVASKSFSPSVTVTAGVGWGRLATYQGRSNPFSVLSDSFDTRPEGLKGTGGGQVEAAKWFRGDMGVFGGLSWAVTPRLTFKAEYSTDAYIRETSVGNINRTSPINLGLEYQVSANGQLSAYYMHGSELGLAYSYKIDPTGVGAGLSRDGVPTPVARRPAASLQDLGWTAALASAQTAVKTALGQALAPSGILVEDVFLSGQSAIIQIDNTIYGAQAQAIGRTARVASVVLPASIETIEIVPVVRGLPTTRVRLARSALEQLEGAPDNAQALLAATEFLDAAFVAPPAGPDVALDPAFKWALGPYIDVSLFDPDSPLRYSIGAELSAEWNPFAGFYLSGALRQRVIGNVDDTTRASDSVIEHVRSDANLYDREGALGIPYLTASYFFRPGENLYGRVTAGYLEKMYGGVSAEVLWKPVDSRLAFGVEINAVKQRSFDMGFGFNPLTIDPDIATLQPLSSYPEKSYSVITGHVSAYYKFENGFHGQLDVGRYLAGDWGATVSLNREFANGWRVGAYATLTDVPFSQFGEGSFDKGLIITIPFNWQLGTVSRQKNDIVLQPLTRDGGARLYVRDRLYEIMRDTHQPDMTERWGRFWR